MSLAVDITDGVVALLNGAPGGTFSEPFTARRRFVPTFTLGKDADPHTPDLSELRIEVIVPPVQTMERSDRDVWQYDFPIALGIARKLAAGDDDARETETETLTTLVEKVVDWLRDDARDTVAEATLDRVEPHQNFHPEMFDEQHEFFAVVVLHYRLWR